MVKKLNLFYIQSAPTRVLAIDEKYVAIYDRYILDVEATNYKDKTKC